MSIKSSIYSLLQRANSWVKDQTLIGKLIGGAGQDLSIELPVGFDIDIKESDASQVAFIGRGGWQVGGSGGGKKGTGTINAKRFYQQGINVSAATAYLNTTNSSASLGSNSNISSVINTSTGQYTINLSITLNNTNAVVVCSAYNSNGNVEYGNIETTRFYIHTFDSSGALANKAFSAALYGGIV